MVTDHDNGGVKRQHKNSGIQLHASEVIDGGERR